MHSGRFEVFKMMSIVSEKVIESCVDHHPTQPLCRRVYVCVQWCLYVVFNSFIEGILWFTTGLVCWFQHQQLIRGTHSYSCLGWVINAFISDDSSRLNDDGDDDDDEPNVNFFSLSLHTFSYHHFSAWFCSFCFVDLRQRNSIIHSGNAVHLVQ